MAGSKKIDPKSKLMMQARLLRRSLRRMSKMLRYGRDSLNRSPVLFANSFPKSGTHLLTQVLAGFSQIGPAVDSGLPAIVTFRGDSGWQRTGSEILADLNRLLPGDIAYGHIHALPEIVDCLLQEDFAVYFILRDPRDVTVSHVHYLSAMAPNHIHHRYFFEVLKDFDTRLQASIQGVDIDQLKESYPQPGEVPPLPLPDIRSRFEPFMGWLGYPQILVMHFEDFISNRMGAIGRVFEHAISHGFQPRCSQSDAVDRLASNIDPSRSPTFRSGKIGGWREAFSAGHKQTFKLVTGDLLIRLGYESDSNW